MLRILMFQSNGVLKMSIAKNWLNILFIGFDPRTNSVNKFLSSKNYTTLKIMHSDRIKHFT